MKKKTSAAVIIAAISTSFLPVASQAATYTLDEIIVEGDRNHEITQQLPGGYENKSGSIGILGKKDTMETPFQQNNISQKSISTFASNPSEQSTSVLVNVPSYVLQEIHCIMIFPSEARMPMPISSGSTESQDS